MFKLSEDHWSFYLRLKVKFIVSHKIIYRKQPIYYNVEYCNQFFLSRILKKLHYANNN